MKTPSSSARLLSGGTMLLTTLLAAGGLLAQDNPYSLEIVDSDLLTAGKAMPATLPRIADVLRNQYPDANIVLAPELEQVTVPNLKLRSTGLPETLEALRIASGEAFIWHLNSTEASIIDPTTGLPVTSPKRTANSLYILSIDDSLAGSRRTVEVFNLTEYLARLGKNEPKEVSPVLDQLKEIVSGTLDQVMLGRVQPNERPSFQFHPGANLFIVIGTPEAIDVARKVVNALPGVVGMRDFASQGLAERPHAATANAPAKQAPPPPSALPPSQK